MLLALLLAIIHPASITTVAIENTTAPLVFHTYVRGRFQSFGYGGEMRITITDGFVNGSYRPDTGGTRTTVHGGTQGSNIWLDIATLGGLRINGTMDANGAIRGMGSSRTGGEQWVFTATPER